MKSPQYLEAVKAARKEVLLTGELLLVEKIEQDEIQRKSGLIIATSLSQNQTNGIGSNMPVFAHVLAAGEGHYDPDTGKDVPLTTEPGDVIMIGQLSVRWLPVFPIDNYKPFSIGLVNEAETQMRFRGLEQYKRFEEKLNKGPEEQMEFNFQGQY